MFPLSSGWSSFPHASQLPILLRWSLNFFIEHGSNQTLSCINSYCCYRHRNRCCSTCSNRPRYRGQHSATHAAQITVSNPNRLAPDSDSSVSPVSNSPSSHNVVSPGPSSGFHTYASDSSASNSPHTYVSPVPPSPKNKKTILTPRVGLAMSSVSLHAGVNGAGVEPLKVEKTRTNAWQPRALNIQKRLQAQRRTTL